MSGSIELFLGLLDREESPCISAEDFDGPHGPMLKFAQQIGLIEQEPGMNPIASCPYCEDGIPVSLGEKLLCGCCLSIVDLREMLLWKVNVMAFLAWIRAQWCMSGSVQQLDGALWQLGTLRIGEEIFECFYRRRGLISETAQSRLSAYRQAIVLFGISPPALENAERRPHLSLLELVQEGPPLALAGPLSLLRPHGTTRFVPSSGALWAGDTLLGEVPLSSKEFYFLDCLARHLDTFVPYADLKLEVLRRSGSNDSRDEATFCHRLKSALKKKYIVEIDRYVTTTNKGEGYRLRAHLAPHPAPHPVRNRIEHIPDSAHHGRS